MMNRAIFVSVGLVVCLASAVQVNAGCLLNLFGGSSSVDFDGLNKWLVKSLPDEQAAGEQNVAHLKANLESLAGPGLRRAGELFVEFMGAQQCNEQVMEAAKELYEAGMLPTGLKRIERVMAPRLAELRSLCGPIIDDRVSELYKKSLEASLGRFLELIVLDHNKWPHPLGKAIILLPGSTFDDYIRNRKNVHLGITDRRWAHYLKKLAEGDPKAVVREAKLNEVKGKYETKYYPGNFSYIHHKYLKEPCEMLTNTLGDTFQALYHLSQNKFEFINERSITVKQLLFGFNQCATLLAITPKFISNYM